MSDAQPDLLTLDFRIPHEVPATLPVLALRRGAMLPGGVIPLALGRNPSIAAAQAVENGGLLLVAMQVEPVEDPSPAQLNRSAVLARVVDRRTVAGHPPVLVVQGLARVRLTGFPSVRPHFSATFELLRETWPDTPEAAGLFETLREEILASSELFGGDAKVRSLVQAPLPPPLKVDLVAGLLDAPADWRRDLLETADPVVRAEKLLQQLGHARAVGEARKAVRERMETDSKGLHKEAVLRRQLKAIQDELGEEDHGDELERLRQRLAEVELPVAAREAVDRELKRIPRINPQSPERTVAIDWLEWVADLPWGKTTANEGKEGWLDALEAALEESHYGLAEVKRQVVEHLSVRALSGSGRADVLLLVGPPGVGKTSIGAAIAEATGRELVRVALGGVRDEASLRGHRRTYVGARPGRLIEGLRTAKTADPVILLDEVDKLGRGWMGDPSAALLEILDPEQNHAFTDHYLELAFDLSKVLFIATANDLGEVPAALRDRMEVLDIPGYTRDEKVRITQRHLLGKLATNAGLAPGEVEIEDEALREVISGWTREAGVRGLQRTLGKIFRAVAVKKARGQLTEPLLVKREDLVGFLGRRKLEEPEREHVELPGVATGLAWTPVGGDVLYVEAATMPGRGQLILTGQLGDVMKESARAALTYVLSHSAALGFDPAIVSDKDVHLHVPAGAVPKDGPSAGVTMFTALASLLTGRPVRGDVAMTGEATLRGRVLPVGGIKAKVLAAHRHGMKRVILPRKNGPDLEDVPAEALAELDIVLVDLMEEALAAALVPLEEVAGAESHAA